MWSTSAKVFWKTLFVGTLFVALGFIFGCGKKAPPTETEVIEAARRQAEAGGYGPAIATLENYLGAHPGAFAVIDALAFTASESGDPALAAFYFARAAEVDPAQPEYLLYAAAALAESGDNAGAADTYRRYLTARPSDSGAWIALAQLNEDLGNRSSALDAYLQANRNQPSSQTQATIGELYLRSGNLAQAQTWFASASESTGESRQRALLGLLEVALRAQRFADAEQLVSTLDEDFPEALDQSSLSDARTQLAAWRSAQAEAEAAVAALGQEEAPETSIPAETTPSAETESTPTPTESTAVVTQSTEPEPESSDGVIATPDSDDSTDPLESDLEETDKEFDVAVLEAELAANEANAESAEVIPPDPSDYELLLDEAREQALEGDFENASRNFQRALARRSSDPHVWLELSEVQHETGEHIRAAASASEAVRRAPEDPVYLLHYLSVAAPTMPPARLVHELEAARQDFPQSPEVALALGEAYEKAGSFYYADRMYAVFLRLAGPEHPERERITRHLESGQ